MRIGTPGFVAGKLTEAREARGLSQTALSELTGIKAQSLSHYEQGRQSPSPEALALLCDGLHLSERFFLRPIRTSGDHAIFFRPTGLPSKPARIKAARRLEWIKEIAFYLRQYVDFPASRLPSCPVSQNSPELGAEIERIADEMRAAFRLGYGPLGNLIALLEGIGCIVACCDMDPDLGGSYSQREDSLACIVLRSADSRSSWARFHAAHELGHMVLHSHLVSDVVSNPAAHRIAELQADRFARAFLLPERVFGKEVWAPTIDALLTLKKEWRVPVQVMVSRCGEIGRFDADQVRRSVVNLSRRGWKTSEPREFAAEGEAPRLLAQSVRLLIDEGPKDAHTVLCDLGLEAADVEELTGLPDGYFAGCKTSSPTALRLRNAVTGEGVHAL